MFLPEILIEQLETSSMSMKEVFKFRLESGICWRSSAAFDFANFEVAAPQDIQLSNDVLHGTSLLSLGVSTPHCILSVAFIIYILYGCIKCCLFLRTETKSSSKSGNKTE